MRFGPGLAGTEFTLFPWLRATGRTTNSKDLLPFGFHDYIVPCCCAIKWSIVTSDSHRVRAKLPTTAIRV